MEDDVIVTAEDLNLISKMLKLARQSGLETEVVWSFYQSAASGDDIVIAVAYALDEWDI